MPFGLQIFDSAGNTVLDTSDGIPRLVGEYSVSLPHGNSANRYGSISVSGMARDGTWHIVASRPLWTLTSGGTPQVISGTFVHCYALSGSLAWRLVGNGFGTLGSGIDFDVKVYRL
jgi:hypothetical protein